MNKLFFAIFFTLITYGAVAQDPLTERFLLYSKAKNPTNLFVHFDKNVYSSNETIWFTGYLISTSNISKHKLMSVSLISNTNNKVILEDRFIMQGGYSWGSLVLPDSIQPGQYRLLAITDYQINNKPEVSFTQTIAVKSMLEPPFKASMKILETNANGTKVLVSATTADNRFLPKPLDVTYKYGNLTSSIKTDNSGQAIITLPKGESLTDPTIYVRLQNEKDSTSLNIPIPQPKGTPSVKFYPEGGDLVTGLINNIGLEVRNYQQRPIAVKAYLLKNDVAIDSTISSNANGLGSFKLVVQDGAKYTFKVKGANLKDTIFSLPKAKGSGIILNVEKAVVSDTLRINIRAKQPQEVNIRVHNYNRSFLYTKLPIQPGSRSIKIPLAGVPKGLSSITITDADERPLAERIFFAHYDKNDKVGIAVGKNSYGLREKVNLKLNLLDAGENAIVSVAVVQDSRIDNEKMTDIESYTFLNNQLADLPNNEKGQLIRNQDYLEQVLLVKGWRRYTWNDFLAVKPADTIRKYTHLELLGNLTKSKKQLNKPASIGAMLNDRMRFVTTDNKGYFDFNSQQLYIASGKKIFLFLNKGEDPSLKFNVDNQLLDYAKTIALNPNAYKKEVPTVIENNVDLFVKSNEKSIRLQEVTITGKAGVKILRGVNACGDFVCRFNVFNCRNHYGDPTNMQPIAGKMYLIDGVMKPYPSCNVSDESIFFRTEGVHLHKEFYVDSYKDPQEPAYFTTIYWNYAMELNKNKPTSLDFYTTDITGKFRVVVQGLTNKQVIYGEKFFEVKRK